MSSFCCYFVARKKQSNTSNKMRKTKEPIRLRQREISNGNISLYLDIYINGVRTYEYLHLYLIPEKTKKDKETNQKTMQLAEAVRSQRIVEYQNGRFGFQAGRLQTDFFSYTKKLAAKKSKTGSTNHYNYTSMLNHVQAYARKDRLPFSEITPQWAEGFSLYLQDAKRINRYKDKTKPVSLPPLSRNGQHLYWVKFRAVIRQALKDGIIKDDPCMNVEGIREQQSERVYLTMEEIRKMIKFPCRDEVAKRAFLFSCLTGLRKSDIERLTWSDVSQSDGYWRITFRQQKTKNMVYLDISEEARAFMGERGEDDDPVFDPFNYSDKMNLKLQHWALAAGVNKRITFHSARHTFALLLLEQSTDIYTVSKLLGHTDVRTTQIYAHILDEKKRSAIEKIPSVFGKE